jgi:prepilin-type N-terminal cleavage/methylation domain-containing protein
MPACSSRQRGAGTRSRSGAGLTLLEMMIVTAVSSILMLAAVALLASMQQIKSSARKALDRMDQSFSAAVVLERSLLNVGYHFPSARYGFRVYNNVTGTSLQGQQVGGACDTCIVANTDMVELVEGSPGPFGRVTGTTSIDAGIPLDPPGGPLAAGVPGIQLFLFSNANEESCLARGNISADGLTIENLVYVDRETLSPQPANYFPGTGFRNFACPTAGMFVSVAVRRQRFFVSQDDAGVRSLRVLNLAPTGLFPDAGASTLLVRGVDNLQVMPMVTRADAGFTTGCTQEMCFCNAGQSCTIAGNEFQTTERVVGARIRLSVLGGRVEQGVTSVSPSLADETLTADTTRRRVQEQTVSFRNFSQVDP